MHDLTSFLHAETDLVSGSPKTLTFEESRALNLAPWAYFNAPKELAWRPQATAEFAYAWRRYRIVAERTATLLRIWANAGIEVLLYKGLAMAAYVYPHPALRYFGDVDLMLNRERLEEAVALAQGWLVVRGEPSFTNSYITLVDADTGLRIDVHVSLVPLHSTGQAENARLMQTVLQQARPEQFEGVRVMLPCAADLVLFGLAMNRGWSRDGWRPKVHDYLDIHYARQRLGLTLTDIEKRARELRVERTWRAFSRNCDPFANRLRLVDSRSATTASWRSELSVIGERIPPRIYRFAVRVVRTARLCPLLPCAFLQLFKTLWMLRREGPPERIVQIRPNGTKPRVPDFRVAQAVILTCFMFDRLIRSRRAGLCVIRSATLFRTLTAYGHSVEWVFGFRKSSAGSAEGHAWVEKQRIPVTAFRDELAPVNYVETFRSGPRILQA